MKKYFDSNLKLVKDVSLDRLKVPVSDGIDFDSVTDLMRLHGHFYDLTE